jgi:hypothetical protein
MDGDAADEPMTHVWRMSAGRQAQFLLLALIATGIGVFMGGGAILYPGYVIIGTIVIIAACTGATWSALQLRNSLTLTGETLIVCTATKTHKISFQQVTYVSAGAYGIYIRTSDGLKITSLVAENSRWSQRFGPEDKGQRHCGCYQRCHRGRPSRGGGRTGVRGGTTGVRGGITGLSGAGSCASGARS